MNINNLLKMAKSYEQISKKAQESLQQNPFTNVAIGEALFSAGIIKGKSIPELVEPYNKGLKNIKKSYDQYNQKLYTLSDNYNSWLGSGPENTSENIKKKERMEEQMYELEETINNMKGTYGFSVTANPAGQVKINNGKPFPGQEIIFNTIKEKVPRFLSERNYTNSNALTLEILPSFTLE